MKNPKEDSQQSLKVKVMYSLYSKVFRILSNKGGWCNFCMIKNRQTKQEPVDTINQEGILEEKCCVVLEVLLATTRENPTVD